MEKHPITKYRVFTSILYPDECIEHQIMFEWILQHYQVCFIKHDKDIVCPLNVTFDIVADDNEEDKVELIERINHLAEVIKPHIHIMWYCPESTTVSAQRKFFRHWCNGVLIQGVTSPRHMVYYFIHDTPECIAFNKHKYAIDDLYAEKYFRKFLAKDAKLHKMLILRNFLYNIRDENIINIIDIINSIDDIDEFEVFVEYRTLFSTITRDNQWALSHHHQNRKDNE